MTDLPGDIETVVKAAAAISPSPAIVRVHEVYDSHYLMMEEFKQKYSERRILALDETFTLNSSMIDLAELTMIKFTGCRGGNIQSETMGRGHGQALMLRSDNTDFPFLILLTGEGKRSVLKDGKRKLKVTVVSHGTLAKEILDWFQKSLASVREATFTFHYFDDSRRDSTTIVLDNVPPVHPEFYPYMNPSPMVTFERFMNSDAQLLFLSGAPGTGKTSYIRAMIQEHSLQAAVAYDQRLLTSDGFFVEFLTEDDTNVLIFEDAEALIQSRELTDGLGPMTSKFLNITDGIIKLSKKKMIFTTNSPKISRIDPAMLRLGRCFGVLEFNPLTEPQAREAARIAKLSPPQGKTEYTLAEIFNPDQKEFHIDRVGF